MNRAVVVVLLVGCAEPSVTAREQRIRTALFEDNWLWAVRDPELTRLKLVKMQRGPYEWLRGTASLFWRDVSEPGIERAASAFGDEASSRVLLVGDPHPENVGTFRASDDTMFLDWNDFDGSGYGPFTGDLRRLGTGLAIAAPTMADALVRRATIAYAQTIAMIASGAHPAPIGRGRSALFDDELDKARERGDVLFAIDELAPVGTDGKRVLALGDLEAIAPDGVLEDRVTTISAEHADWIDRVVAAWRADRTDGNALGAIKLRARRIGPGVSSYAAFRWNVVLEGATTATTDDRVIEIKETREGLIIRGLPRRSSAEWDAPAARSTDTQRRLQARPDADALLGSALVGGLSVKIRDREAFQRGINRDDLTALSEGNANEQAELLAIAAVYGELLARAHGLARTEDGVLGWQAIAPLLANREAAFADDIAGLVLADAALITADHALMKDRDLFAEVIP